MSAIQSIERALNLLSILGGAKDKYSIADLASQADLAPSTIHRILQTLCSMNFVVKDEGTHMYRLGPALIPLGKKAIQQTDLYSQSQLILKSLSLEIQEDSFFMVRTGYKGIILSQVDGPHNLKIVERFGYELELHCGAMRKVLLAFEPESFWDEYISFIQKANSRYPLKDVSKLKNALHEIRRNGFAVSHNDYIQNSYGIGFPVFKSNNTIAGVIGTIMPEIRTSPERLSKVQTQVQKSAEQLSAILMSLH